MKRFAAPALAPTIFACIAATVLSAGCYVQSGVGITHQGNASYNIGAGLSIALGQRVAARIMVSGSVSNFDRDNASGKVTGGVPVLGLDYRARRFGDGSVSAPALVLSGDLHAPFGSVEFATRAVSSDYAMRMYLGASYEHPFLGAATQDNPTPKPWGYLRAGAGPELFISSAEAFGSANTFGAATTVSFTTDFSQTLSAIDCWVRKQCE